jgi:hypothetical protein
LTGSVIGQVVPATGTTFVAWVVSSGSPDYTYKTGDGTSTGTTFMVGSIASPPPPEALNMIGTNTLGVGIVVLLPAGTTIPDGILSDTALDTMEGFTLQHAIIWRTGDFSTMSGLEWINDFPESEYRCGVCVPATGQGFDTFAPAACSDVVIDVDENNPVCNWT